MTKYLIGFTIIVIILVSTFAFLSKSQSTEIARTPATSTQSTPAPTPEATNKIDHTPAPVPQSRINPDIPQSGGPPPAPTPTPHPPGFITSAQTANSTVWTQIATAAWAFFQPGIGVDPSTGLPYAGGTGFEGFTDWDLGDYIQAVIDAQKIGVISTNGTEGSYARFNQVLTFLETRPLNENTTYPFQFYDATTGGRDTDYPIPDSINFPDEGRLLVSLNNLRLLNSNFTNRINNLVYDASGARTNYSTVLSQLQNAVSANYNSYGYYIYSGFASFWPNQLGKAPDQILTGILSSNNITTFGINLPQSALGCEPLLSAVFEINNTDNAKLMGLMTNVYLACEASYNQTGQFEAPSEGSTPESTWVYEWVVSFNGNPWEITDGDLTTTVDMSPVVYTKVALGFLALYNTTYALNMNIWLEATMPLPTYGFWDGADVNGNVVNEVGDNSNGLILDAAMYALQKGT